MNCPKCSSDNYIKSGKINGTQRYGCKSCNRHYTVAMKSTAKPASMKKFALQLYLEGLGFRSIGRLLDVSNVAILKWIKHFGKEVSELRSGSKIEIVEIDEMHTYIGNKKTTIGFGLLLIEMAKNSSISYLATEVRKQEKSYGNQSRINKPRIS